MAMTIASLSPPKESVRFTGATPFADCHHVDNSPSLTNVESCDPVLTRETVLVPERSWQSNWRAIGWEGGHRQAGRTWRLEGAEDRVEMSDVERVVLK